MSNTVEVRSLAWKLSHKHENVEMARMRPAVKAGLRSLIGVDPLFMRQLLVAIYARSSPKSNELPCYPGEIWSYSLGLRKSGYR
jgi:hypothetical protein